MMHPAIRTYLASDGYRLHYRHWQPEAAPPRGRIVALHGIQSHSGWYEWSSRKLCEAGYELFFLDRRGSGMNERDRGDAADCEQWIDDITHVLRRARGAEDDARPSRVILLGVSWGGKLATAVAAHRPTLIDGLALLYPGLWARVRARWDQNLRLSIAERLGIRRKRVRIPLDDPALFTGEPRWQEYIRNDPLALREVTVSFLLANRRLDRLLPRCPAAITRPALLMLAGSDRIIDNEATRTFFGRFAAADRTLWEYPQAQHTLEFEPPGVRERFLADLLAWLNRVCGSISS